MKKPLAALAALAVTGLASAQSSVTLFGVVDAGVSYQSAATGATARAACRGHADGAAGSARSLCSSYGEQRQPPRDLGACR